MEYWAAFAVMSFSIMLAMYFIQNIKFDFKSKKMWISYFFCLGLFILNFEFCADFLRIVCNYLLYVLFACLLFKNNMKSSFVLGTIIMVVNIVSELIYAVITYPLVAHTLFINNPSLLVFVQNLLIGLLIIILSLFLNKINIYRFIVSKLSNIKSKRVVVFSLLSVVIFNFIIWIMYFSSNELYNDPVLSFIGSIISLFCVVLVFSYLKTNNQYVDISEKYSLSLENIKDYEQIIESNRINNHEIRNQFLMIRNISKNKKVTSYIDSILNNNLSDSEELLNEVVRIPSGGLRGVIYTKILCMQEQQIEYELYVDKKITSRKINTISSNCMVDICKIIGVFLDNAIEAVNELKEKRITVEIFNDGKDIVISITNNFRGCIDIENFENSGYTTKSEGHGYGLKLVRDILDKNDRLENYKEFYEDNFTQNLKIKM